MDEEYTACPFNSGPGWRETTGRPVYGSPSLKVPNGSHRNDPSLVYGPEDPKGFPCRESLGHGGGDGGGSVAQ